MSDVGSQAVTPRRRWWLRRPDHSHTQHEDHGAHHYRRHWWWYDDTDEHGHPAGRSHAVHLEYWALSRDHHGVGCSIKWGTAGSETTPDLAAHFGPLGSIWLSFERVFPARWFDRRNPDGTPDYDSRLISINADRRHLEWNLWTRHHGGNRDIPRWRRPYIVYDRLVYGRDNTETIVLDTGTCSIPLPEGPQPAIYTVTRYVHHRTRPLGRLRDRLAGPRIHHHTEVRPGRPSPVPGKGENTWDCGDDAIWSTSVPGRSIDNAIAAHTAAVLRDRRLHGGEHMSFPEAAS